MPDKKKPSGEVSNAEGPGIESNVRAFFVCGPDGRIFAASGIALGRLKNVPPPHGKIVRAKSQRGAIKVNPDLKNHVTHLTLDTSSAAPDELHIRVPIGLKFFRLSPTPAEVKKLGFDTACFFEANDGYNVLPVVIPKGMDGQQVQELVLVTSHVPPRSGPIDDRDVDAVATVSGTEVRAIQKPDQK